MNKEQYLLICLAEECAEVQKTVSKCLRFGLNNHNPNDDLEITNWKRLTTELGHINHVVLKLIDKGVISKDILDDGKGCRLDKYMEYSRKIGILEAR